MKVEISKKLTIEELDALGNVNDLVKEVLFEALALNKKVVILGDQPAWNLTLDTENLVKKILEVAFLHDTLTESMVH
ncbi:hypothetical protein NYE67_02815 [Solibacillus sp. FSL W8-0474]|uniref:hypothetical protein n=1 Tax=Solibacillus sp. FSL W8-0474 TaxID=2975336 RepID=UPI0030FCF133